MISSTLIRNAVIALLALGGSFAATVFVRSQPPAGPPVDPAASTHSGPDGHSLEQRLGLTEDQARRIAELSPTFEDDLRRLREELEAARLQLAAAFDEGHATDETIQTLAEATIEAHNRLERAVIKHLLVVRHHLTAEQQKRLFEICAEGVREGGGRRWRHGRDAGAQSEGGQGQDRGEHAPGRGRGRGPRGGG
jgi:Spy/CpxP family protein refolding chaperone